MVVYNNADICGTARETATEKSEKDATCTRKQRNQFCFWNVGTEAGKMGNCKVQMDMTKHDNSTCSSIRDACR